MNKSTLYLQAFVRAVKYIVYSIFGQLAYRGFQCSVVLIEQGF